MRNTQSHSILKGAGLLGVGTILGFSQLASAAPRLHEVKEARQEVKQARKEVREERKDVRKADTRSERRDAKGDLRDAKGDLRDARQDLKQEQRELQLHKARQDNTRRYEANRRYQANRQYGSNQRHDWNNQRDFRTLEGRVADDLQGESFMLRTNNGQQVHVHLNNEPDRIDEGDYVRVYGHFSNGVFRAQNFTIVRNR